MNTLTQAKILTYLRDNREFLETQFGVTKIALCGSYARNEARADSDIDLLIETRMHSFKNRFYLKEHLEKHFNRKVDIGYFDSVRLFIWKQMEADLIYA